MSRSQEVAEAVGVEGGSLERKRERLREITSRPSERDVAARELMEVETEIARRDLATLTDAAEKRLLGIRRALGSLADESKDDNARLLDAAQEFAKMVTALNDRFEKCIALRHEAASLAEVFGLQMPELPTVVVPALRKEVSEAFAITSRVRVRDNGSIRPMYDEVRLPDGRFGQGVRNFTEPELAGTLGVDLIRRKRG